ncbi:ATP synthase f chain, mitochondrial precursor [Coemansia sp. RSA 2711]|nr:ATP synthase f chain, mitochondrial precursor [Coemansia sp. RSA 2711]KAJ1845186.1 ATP synthase f chain, mitochondrial precursor [Coemansia sp. RSA 2708]KAJ2305725.1 ATP synthase f chain, mitochondrial precursor [Coemansia sp. RSA 2704]KAJ2309255.1 ATP synthase f chain, mitochondrial precursor [Coemansia sp. RSA 2705]KAJ2361567.1 ATP synthase f chain, mitochondrial precursor [Coemansia sp. RSA 2610]KAJ2389715.1 ATP synthase f chain, mitochondrial precursor [Coemansia sp. RSA 2611]KAJ271200
MNAVIGRTALKRAAGFRNYASLREIIPPNIGFAARAGESVAEATPSTLSAQQVEKVVSLYRNLPKGQAEAKAAGRGPFSRYYARYIEGKNASAAPIGHFIAVMLVGGYSIHYVMHLKHHKHAEHH